jgi:hypothetical protein
MESSSITLSSLVVSIRFPLSAIVEPSDFPLLSPNLLRLDLVPRHLLLLRSDLGDDLSLVARPSRGGSSGRATRTDTRANTGGDGGGSGGLGGGLGGGGVGRVGKGVLDEGDLALVGESTGVDVPNLRRE